MAAVAGARLRWRAAGVVFLVVKQPCDRVCASRALATVVLTVAAALARWVGTLEADFWSAVDGLLAGQLICPLGRVLPW